MAERGSVRPRKWEVGIAALTGRDVPQRNSPTTNQHATLLPIQARLIGDIHLNVLAEYDIKDRVGEGQFSHVCLANRNPPVESDEAIEPAGSFADPATRVEHLRLGSNSDHVNQLACGDAPHGVKVLQRREVRWPQVVEILSGGTESTLDVAPGQARGVVLTDLGVCHLMSAP